jgi:NAD(P)-dependent dehydrogenase (short-subunit alcohol dehydrogenase family)
MRLDGRVAIVTGAGRGIGRAHALELARHGARVVVNDLGVALDGHADSDSPAQMVVREIADLGGEAVSNHEDVADSAGAQSLIRSALDAYGRLDVLVNNAGIIRDRMLVNLSDDDWDAVIRVHLRGTFAPVRAASRHWRELSKSGEANDARIINTTSGSGIYGNVGQTNYGAAKAGIAAMTVIAAIELGRYGITVNAIAPGARTRMTETPDRKSPSPFAEVPGARFDHGAPENISPLVAWLASPESAAVTGRVFNIHGGSLSIAQGWHASEFVEQESRFTLEQLDGIVPDLLAKAPGRADMTGRLHEGEGHHEY